VGRVFRDACIYVCAFVIPHYISKSDAARITKPDVDMATMSPGNPFILGSKVKVMRYKNIAGMGHGTVVSAGFF